jgi:hypothetical protein
VVRPVLRRSDDADDGPWPDRDRCARMIRARMTAASWLSTTEESASRTMGAS